MLAPAIDYLGDQFLLRCMIAKFHNIASAKTAGGPGGLRLARVSPVLIFNHEHSRVRTPGRYLGPRRDESALSIDRDKITADRSSR
jgi:hypothetical protein